MSQLQLPRLFAGAQQSFLLLDLDQGSLSNDNYQLFASSLEYPSVLMRNRTLFQIVNHDVRSYIP